jgi:AcrR family transcriptional regulator
MSTVSDPRVVRTRKALRAAMIDLATDRPLDAITVVAITARAGVSYPTFFRHYADKEALLDDVTDVVTQDFLAHVRPLLRARDRLAAARALCAFGEENPTIHKALIAGGAGETVRAGLLRRTLEVAARTRTDTAPSVLDDLLLFHVISTGLNLLAWWLSNPEHIDADTMAEFIERTLLTPVASLRHQPPAGFVKRAAE